MKLYVLFEHAAGYAVFKSNVDEASIDVLKSSISSVADFQQIVETAAFQPFASGRDALENMNSVSEGILHPDLQVFLENVPKLKKKHTVLGVAEPKLGAAIQEKLQINCSTTGIVPEMIRAIRLHFQDLVDGFTIDTANKSQLGLGHHYSRARVKFNVNRIDNMIIQSISLLDQLDKDINTFSMRVREWYSHHFPELIRIVPENAIFIQCIQVIRDRKDVDESVVEKLEAILNDPVKVQKVLEVSQNSMGMDISPIDLENVYEFAERILSLMQRRTDLQEYLRSKMNSVAPNLAALIGDMVGARLIAKAGSLTNLAKAPASTVQILGAEKALFRAIKTHGNTPKYGLIYHSRFIAKAAKSNKGRISRYLANKCSVACRIDCFRENPTDVFGCKLRDQVDQRLRFFETGELPATNIDVMEEAETEADALVAKDKKKKKKKSILENGSKSPSQEIENFESVDVTTSGKKKKKLSNYESVDVDQEKESVDFYSTDVSTSGKKKKRSNFEGEDVESPKKKKLRESVSIENGDIQTPSKKKKKKSRKLEAVED